MVPVKKNQVQLPSLVRTSRGRVQVLPSRFNDSVINDWKKDEKINLRDCEVEFECNKDRVVVPKTCNNDVKKGVTMGKFGYKQRRYSALHGEGDVTTRGRLYEFANNSVKASIERYKKACSDTSGVKSASETNAQYYQQEAAKRRVQISNLHNHNRQMMGEALRNMNGKELRNLESKLEKGISRIRSKKNKMLFAEIEYKEKVFCFALSPNDSTEWRQHIQAEAEHFLDVPAMTVDTIKRLINKNKVQILFNPNTKGAKMKYLQ
ncbi:hypothetical protein KIW84_032629 [Lathyrus oleraceus]|uniref:K-box domain-containing protein n=1 Tax=Pisum sativum TaxID=3888 RepID=A0A9D4XVE5_PEA|nr:hypothetical protein KIW84_032629 [Pisum sativum]